MCDMTIEEKAAAYDALRAAARKVTAIAAIIQFKNHILTKDRTVYNAFEELCYEPEEMGCGYNEHLEQGLI